MSIERSLLALAGGDTARAVELAEAAAAARPERRLPAAWLRHLQSGTTEVYDDPRAFERFIESGGNRALYGAAGTELATRHAALGPRRVLDLGCGDGRLTVTALQPALEMLDLVEPSSRLLAAALQRVGGQHAVVVGHGMTAEAYLAAGAGPWDVAQSTFALHTLTPDARRDVLAALAASTATLLVVEFDVPAFEDRSEAHAAYAAERYEAGLAEHDCDGDDLVARGFLMPVLAGQFAPDRPRHTWEQPIDAWTAELGAAGFASVEARWLSDYWWAPAHVIEAQAR